jgi:hypothetical protein
MEFIRARNTDPATSHMAAHSIKDAAKIHHDLIVDCLKRFGPMGKDGIALHTNINGSADGNAVARRLPEIEKLGLVEQTGRLVLSKSGRKEREWAYVIPQSLFPLE